MLLKRLISKTYILLLLTTCMVFSSFSDEIPKNDSEYYTRNLPVPEWTKERLFYIQRTMNTNTIVYDANFDCNGNLNREKPINVYWIRYEEDGGKMPLRMFERNFVFGVKTKQREQNCNEYDVNILVFKNRKIRLKQIAPFKAKAFIEINNEEANLEHIYVKANGFNAFSKVMYIELYGNSNVNEAYERIIINQ